MRRIAVVYSLLGVFFGSDRLLRQGTEATSVAAGASDRGSTRAIVEAFGISMLALIIAPVCNALGLGRLSRQGQLFRLGVSGMVAGLLLRVWATQTLGTSYTRTLQVSQEQRVVQSGPYQMIRHPGYSGTLMVWMGASIALANWIAVAIIFITAGRAYRQRIETEEDMLLHTFPGEYPAYAQRTWRLIPFVY